jgi:hypothetical protein
MTTIRDGFTFCIVQGCRTNHTGMVTELKLEATLVVILKTIDRAFADLTLEGGLVPEEVMERWESATRTFKEWHKAFLAVAQDDEMLEDEAGFDSRVLNVQQAGMFKTPGKKRISAPSVLDAFVPYPSTLRTPAIKEQLWQSPMNFSRLGETMVSLDEGLVGLAGSFQHRIIESRESAAAHLETGRMLALKISRIDNLMGTMDVMEESFYAAPTVWSAITTMGADVQKLVNRKVQAPNVDLRPVQAPVDSTEADIKVVTDKIKLQMVALTSGVGARLGKVERAVTRLNASSSPSRIDTELESAFKSSGGRTEIEPSYEELQSRVKELKNLQLETNRMVRKIMAETDSSAVKFGGLEISNEAEVRAWIMMNFSDMHYALIFDIYSVLEAIEDGGPGNQSDLLRDMKKRDDLSVNGIAEGQALTAHLHEIPMIFHSATGKLVGLDSSDTHLSKVPSYKHWSYGSHCLKRKIETELVKVRYANRLIISQHFKHGTVAYSVASEALDKSVTWITGLISFIDRTYESLHGGSANFSAAQAWSLTSQLVRHIFSDLHRDRMGTTRTMGKGRVVICTSLLWSAFKMHDAMAEFEDKISRITHRYPLNTLSSWQ